MISNSGHDEHGRYTGGQAGDQTGNEWTIQNWYNRPWNVVLRFTDDEVANLIADLAEEAAKNNLIGYDQNQRTTFWTQLTASGYRPKNITVPCEADCSAGVAAIVKAAGYILGKSSLKNVSPSAYTGNLRTVLLNAGAKAITDKRFLLGDEWLRRGDILLYEGHHTAINITDGKLSIEWYPSDISVDAEGIEVLSDLNIRSGPGTYYSLTGNMYRKGEFIFPTAKAYNADSYAWFKTKDGWVSGKHLKGWIKEAIGYWWYLEKGYSWPSYCLKKIDGKDYIFDADGWMVTSNRISASGELLPRS